MGIIQVKLNQVLAEFKDSLHSVDIRTAVNKSGSDWQSALMGIRISQRSVEEVQSRHLELEKQFGKRRVDSFAILLQAFPFDEFEKITQGLNGGLVEIEGEKVVFPRKLIKVVSGTSHELARPPWDDLAGSVSRHQELL